MWVNISSRTLLSGGVSSLVLITTAVRPEKEEQLWLRVQKSRDCFVLQFPFHLSSSPSVCDFPIWLIILFIIQPTQSLQGRTATAVAAPSPFLPPNCLEDIWLQGTSMCKRHAKPDCPCLYSRPKVRGQHTKSPGIFKCYGLAHFPCTPDLDLPLYSQDKNVDLETSSGSQKVRILFCIYSVCRVNEALIPSKYAFSTSVLKDTKRRVQLGSLGGAECSGLSRSRTFHQPGLYQPDSKLPSCLKKCQERKRKPRRVRTGWHVDSATKVKARNRLRQKPLS